VTKSESQFLFRVNFTDGTFLENLSFEEADRIVKDRVAEWASVHSMDYAKDCDKLAEGKP
jgi:hypothetical protein